MPELNITTSFKYLKLKKLDESITIPLFDSTKQEFKLNKNVTIASKIIGRV